MKSSRGGLYTAQMYRNARSGVVWTKTFLKIQTDVEQLFLGFVHGPSAISQANGTGGFVVFLFTGVLQRIAIGNPCRPRRISQRLSHRKRGACRRGLVQSPCRTTRRSGAGDGVLSGQKRDAKRDGCACSTAGWLAGWLGSPAQSRGWRALRVSPIIR